ncbi:hypothetical protein Patl1_37581 [Pistacia atlantica]|nr:hypothetical protein Patl1_37581 [Pistacia atlantica]
MVGKKFGHQVEAFFVILTALQFHFLFYCTCPLPNIQALGVVLGKTSVSGFLFAYMVSSKVLVATFFYSQPGIWARLKGQLYAALNCLIFTTIVFRCDMLLLLGPLGIELLLVICCSFSGICLLIFSHYNAAY